MSAVADREPAPGGTSAAADGLAVRVRGLVKRYGHRVAVDGLDLDVPSGTIATLVGPNGSGKTTTVECLEGLRRPDAGSVLVLGMDPGATRRALHLRVGVLLQEGAVYDRIRVAEALWLEESFYPHPRPAGELLDALGLRECAKTLYGNLSGGQKRRLQLALALVGDPELLILDEPTSGLDPQARAGMWEVLREARDRGRTVLVTTHELDEAEEHADRVVIIDRGRVIGDDRPAALLAAHGLRTRATVPADEALDGAALAALAGVTHVQAVGRRLHVFGAGDGFANGLVEAAARAGIGADALELRPAHLEDLFLLLTDRDYRDE
jgi:ABC-2 type transport system ATP-binding protein